MEFEESQNELHNEPTTTEESYDIEFDLERLDEFDNATQLDLLRREIGHIVAHNITPSEGWFDERYKYILNYSNIEWAGLMKRFHNKDHYIHDTAYHILGLITDLIEDRHTKPNFNLNTYHKLIHNVQNIWKYYRQVYVCEDENDTDMMDLIEGIKFL